MAALGAHLYHGVWSLCQTLGFDNPERNQYLKKSALIIALVVAVGFISVPCAVFLGVLKEGIEVALLAH
jgi:succinate dehydrogenase / fumarate reductase cytochrome b subunit